jgi:hypothetical protein
VFFTVGVENIAHLQPGAWAPDHSGGITTGEKRCGGLGLPPVLLRCDACNRRAGASWATALGRSPVTRFPAAAPAPPTGASTIRLSDVPTGAPGDRVTSGGDTQSWMGIRKQRGRAQHMNSESP